MSTSLSTGYSLRTFSSSDAKGGAKIGAATTAVLFTEFQNEFATEKGKLHADVAPCMKETDMLNKAVKVAADARASGAKVMHTAITFSEDSSDNPNKGLGILGGCHKGKLFVRGSWNADFCDPMKPQEGDVVIDGKRGLDTFPGSDLEAQLKANGIETLAIAGFLTNCCCESTMRTAFEKGFNVITLTDCMAATSVAGHKAATEGTFGMFSTPMTADEFSAQLNPPVLARS